LSESKPLTTTPRRAEINALSSGHHVPLLSLHTPVGDLSVAEDDGAIVSVDWGWGRDQDETALLRRAREQLHAYFDLALTTFELPLAPVGSPYRQRVWAALRAIPYGATRTYLDIARDAGGSPRSVGGANGSNPIPIIIPCHRVIATTGIGGFSGGEGLPTKRALLALENPNAAAIWRENSQATLI
jgi:methylated-DNA-[protein]-cysteine S-methyltransferase